MRGLDGTLYIVPNGDIRTLANTSRGWARAVVDLKIPGTSAVDLDEVRQIVESAARRVAERPDFAAQSSEGPTLVGFTDADEATFTLRITLHTVHSQRDALIRALREKDVATLQSVPRVGRKKAEQLILDLADKLDDLQVSGSPSGPKPEGAGVDDAIRALVSLGYSSGDAERAVRTAIDAGERGTSAAELIRSALSKIRG